MTIEAIIARLDGPAAALWDSASAGALAAAAEEVRGAVRAIDEAIAALPERRAQALAAMTSTGQAPSRRPRIADIDAQLETLDREGQQLARLRETGASIAAQLDARLREAKKAEAARDEQRKPFAAMTRRAREMADRFAEGPKLFKQIAGQFRADIELTKLGKGPWSRVPRGGFEVRFDNIVPRVIATPEALSTSRMPGYSPRYFEGLERAYHHPDDDIEEFGAVIAQALRELRELIRSHDERQIVLSHETVFASVARAQTVLVGEYNKTRGAIQELLAIDATITAADRDARYPDDGSLVFDPGMFPNEWLLGGMTKGYYPRLALPSIGSLATAA